MRILHCGAGPGRCVRPRQILCPRHPLFAFFWMFMPLRLRLLAAVALALLVASGCASDPLATPPREPPSDAAADSLLQQIHAQHTVPALATVIVRADSVVAVGAAGVRHRDRPAPVSVHDAFHLGSNTKAMHATLIALLVEAGRLTWDTTPAEVLPGLADTVHPDFAQVTLAQLLAHRSGLAPFTQMSAYQDVPGLDGPPKAQRLAFSMHLLQNAPAHAPDSAFVYSNAGYGVSAAMAEQATGIPWETLMRERLFAPLGIRGGFGWPATADSTQPWGHRYRYGRLQPDDPNSPHQLSPVVAPAGDVHMSMPDYGRFLQLHLRGLRGEPTALLTPEAIQHLHTSQGPMRAGEGAPGYGLGWAIQRVAGAPISSHTGSIGTFKARAAIQASHNLAVAVVANAGDDEADAVTDTLRGALLRQYQTAPSASQPVP